MRNRAIISISSSESLRVGMRSVVTSTYMPIETIALMLFRTGSRLAPHTSL